MSGACVTPLLEGLFEAVVRLLSRSPSILRLRPPNKFSFRQVNRRTGHRLKHKLVDSVTGEAIDASDKARSYEIGENEFLFVEERDLAQARSERPPPGSIPLTEPPPPGKPAHCPGKGFRIPGRRPSARRTTNTKKRDGKSRKRPPAPPVLRPQNTRTIEIERFTVGVGIIPAILLVIGSPAIVAALTKSFALPRHAELHRAAGLFRISERRSKAKAEEAAKAKTGNAPSPSAPDAPATSSAIDHLGRDGETRSGSVCAQHASST